MIRQQRHMPISLLAVSQLDGATGEVKPVHAMAWPAQRSSQDLCSSPFTEVQVSPAPTAPGGRLVDAVGGTWHPESASTALSRIMNDFDISNFLPALRR